MFLNNVLSWIVFSVYIGMISAVPAVYIWLDPEDSETLLGELSSLWTLFKFYRPTTTTWKFSLIGLKSGCHNLSADRQSAFMAAYLSEATWFCDSPVAAKLQRFDLLKRCYINVSYYYTLNSKSFWFPSNPTPDTKNELIHLSTYR